MTNVAQYRRSHDALIGGDVELDARRLELLPRPDVVHPTLNGQSVWAQPKDGFTGGEVDARFGRNACECAPQVCRHVIGKVRTAGQDCEVEILGEAVRLDVALLETRSAFEDPLLAEHGVGTDPPKQPAQYVVLLNDLLSEAPLADALNDVGAGDHEASRVPRFTLIRNPHRRRMCPRAELLGSSAVTPVLRRSTHAAINLSVFDSASRVSSR